MTQSANVIGIEQVLLADSYVLGFSRTSSDIVIEMEFTLVSLGLGQTINGHIVFPKIEKEEWCGPIGEASSLEAINQLAHRYYGGPDEIPDIGTIISICLAGGEWHVVGDWGSCILRTQSPPQVVFTNEKKNEKKEVSGTDITDLPYRNIDS